MVIQTIMPLFNFEYFQVMKRKIQETFMQWYDENKPIYIHLTVFNSFSFFPFHAGTDSAVCATSERCQK